MDVYASLRLTKEEVFCRTGALTRLNTTTHIHTQKHTHTHMHNDSLHDEYNGGAVKIKKPSVFHSNTN